MTRLAKILVMALVISLMAASSAFARAPHQGQTGKDESDTAAIVVVAALGLLIAGSALVPLTRTARLSAR